MKSSIQISGLFLTGLAFVLVGSVNSVSHAKPAAKAPIVLSKLTVKLPPIPHRGAPGRTIGGASRGPCSSPSAQSPQPGSPPKDGQATRERLVALAPIYQPNSSPKPNTSPTDRRLQAVTHVWGLTTAERPTLWFNVPYSGQFITATFSLTDEADNPIYEVPVKLPEKPGIVAVRLPSNVAPLEVGKPYHWYFKVRVACSASERGTLDYVDGWVQRTELDAATMQQLQQTTPQQKAAIYAEKGIWFDTVTTLAELQLADAKTANREDWESLLRSVGLDQLATVPLAR